MMTQNIAVAEQAIGHLSGYIHDDMPLRALRVLFHVARHGPATVREIAKGLGHPQFTVAEDIAALRKVGGKSRVRYSLIQEIQPVTKGKPCCYRLSKRADKIMDDLDYTMQVYALPLDDDEDDELLQRWEASRSIVRG